MRLGTDRCPSLYRARLVRRTECGERDADLVQFANDPRAAPMGILDCLVSISEEFAWQARLRVLDQRRTLELFERQGDEEAVRRAQVMLATLERAYGVALDRLNADRAISSQSQPANLGKAIPKD